ncbi:MAG: hypothetical protein LBQ42_00960 [Synergistaceae bacterium]|nr:hypothetical protein [Synergistaceae bacterium]
MTSMMKGKKEKNAVFLRNSVRAPRRRKGVALVLALAIILVSGVVVSFLFDMAFSFAWTSSLQQESYVNHATMLDAIETAKGFILQQNNDDNTLMHVPAVRSADEIAAVSALRFVAPNLSYDVPVRHGAGEQRLEMSVYDMCYEIDKLQPSLTDDREQMRELPPPIAMLSDPTAMVSIAEANVRDWGQKNTTATGGSGSGGRLPLENYGAYLVRAKLYDVDPNGGRKLVRTTESAFVQVLD